MSPLFRNYDRDKEMITGLMVASGIGWLVVLGKARQYFSLYLYIREVERKEKK